MPPFLILNQIAIKTKTAGYRIKSFLNTVIWIHFKN